MFNEVAEVLEMVDSKGAGEIEIVRLKYCQMRLLDETVCNEMSD